MSGEFAPADFEQVEFVDGETLPPCCIACGEMGEQYVVVGERTELPPKDTGFFLSRILAALGGVVAFRIGAEPQCEEYKISVSVPVCTAHTKSRILEPLFVDYQSYRITLPANRKFTQKWRAAKSGGGASTT